ncbi:sulfurtransferase [Tumebacillus algifaecis]|uniref:Sulfurtransferase n=1 Tax=Tumebacillus algifaecis TaxID=1214604 RepID=A0A223D1C2_9BACL|nr:rhodanese-like domain-containing protein [Tumebacillus algifaecis]ASS75243.1 sulfurtransferase [Tumebacillus algifaecis]
MAKPKNISAEDVRARLDRGEVLQILDVREESEVATGLIPGAIHIRLPDVEARYEELDPELETVIVCRSGRRSRSACNFLLQKGFTKLLNMEDGMLAWKGELEDFYS